MAQMGRPKLDKPKSIRVAFRVDEEEYNRLLEYAKKNGLSVSAVLHKGLENVMASDQKH